jgi:predicted hydrocarbon binding protein
MGFLLHREPLAARPRLGGEIHVDTVGSVMAVPTMSAERRYQTAWRMGGVNAGKTVGERLLEAGLSGDQAVERVLDFMNYCKVGRVAMRATTRAKRIRIEENCESFWTTPYMVKWEEPRCFFTTGFLNGLFSAVKDQHVREVKCIAAGEPYCEWEIA